MGHGLTVWTIRISLIAFTVALSLSLTMRGRPFFDRAYRLAWSVGLVAFLFHTASAFHFYHHWSHAAAVADTARQTYELMGWSFGEGIYFSYLFLLLWAADVAWLWIAPRSYFARPMWLHVSIIVYLVFIAFNGAVVFEGGATRIPGIVVTFCLALMCCRQLQRGSTSRIVPPRPVTQVENRGT